MTEVINVGSGASKNKTNTELILGAVLIGGGYFYLKNKLTPSTNTLFGLGSGVSFGGGTNKKDENSGYTQDKKNGGTGSYLNLPMAKVTNVSKKQIENSVKTNPTYNASPKTYVVNTPLGKKTFHRASPEYLANTLGGLSQSDLNTSGKRFLEQAKTQETMNNIRKIQNENMAKSKKQQKATTPTSKVPFSPINVIKPKVNPFSNPFGAIGSIIGGLF